MATPPHATAPSRRLPRAGPLWLLWLLVAVVLGAHAWLAVLLAPQAPRAGQHRGAPVLLRSLPAVAVAVAPSAEAAAPAAKVAPAVVETPTAPAAPARPDSVPAAPAAPAARATAVADAAPAAPADAPARGEVPAVATDPLAQAARATDPDGLPPPVYATRLPPPVTLHYALRLNGRSGSAVLTWQHDGSRYQLTLDAHGDDGRPLLAQASSGSFDGAGVAPERFVDRRGGGRQRAANFRRDTGHITYSGPGHAHPAWPGAQDRLSWLAQLAAVRAAADAAAAQAVPDALELFVADATGQAGLWWLQQRADDADAHGPDGPHWRREPPQPEGLRIDLWLAPPGAAPAGHAGWPRRLRFSVPRSGNVLELVLQPPP